MLTGINPLLTGELLKHLDEMGHSDSVAIVDAHFPARRLTRHLVTLNAATSPEVLTAVCSVLPLDDAPAIDLMTTADGVLLPVQQQLMDAAHVTQSSVTFIDRFDFYDAASSASVIIQTGETRTYGCALARKGLVGHGDA